MKVKTFRGRSTQDVLQQVREALGEKAIILNTQSFKEEGENVCEVMAAVEPEPTSLEAESGPQVSGWRDWHSEWSQFKEQLFSILKPQMEMERLTPRQRLALEHLEREGVSDDVLIKLWERLKDRPNASSLSELSRQVFVRPWSARMWPEKCHALAGPHGAGKTTTILRLALQYQRENPGRKTCLVNADLRQGKGRLYLRHYAELSDFTYLEAAKVEDWLELSRRSQEFDRVFIDIPGLGANEDLSKWWQESKATALKEVAFHVVLSPVYSARQIRMYLKKYAVPKRASLIWTKLDEACSFGELVNASFTTGLPISLFTYNNTLQNSFIPAEDKALWRLILKHELPGMNGNQ